MLGHLLSHECWDYLIIIPLLSPQGPPGPPGLPGPPGPPQPIVDPWPQPWHQQQKGPGPLYYRDDPIAGDNRPNMGVEISAGMDILSQKIRGIRRPNGSRENPALTCRTLQKYQPEWKSGESFIRALPEFYIYERSFTHLAEAFRRVCQSSSSIPPSQLVCLGPIHESVI